MAFKLAEAFVEFTARNEGVVSAVKGIDTSIKGALGGLRQFDSLLRLGLGVGAGEGLFMILHNGLAAAVGGFAEAQQAGMGFFDSLGVGAAKVVGLSTELDKMAERAAKTKQSIDATMATMAGQKGVQDAINPPNAMFPNLRNGGAAETALNALEANAAKASQEALPIRQQIADLRSELNDATFKSSLKNQLKQESLDELIKANKGALDSADAAEEAFRQESLALDDLDAQAKAVAENWNKVDNAVRSAGIELRAFGLRAGPILDQVDRLGRMADRGVSATANSILRGADTNFGDSEILRRNTSGILQQRADDEFDEVTRRAWAQKEKQMRGLGTVEMFSGIEELSRRAQSAAVSSYEQEMIDLAKKQHDATRNIDENIQKMADMERGVTG